MNAPREFRRARGRLRHPGHAGHERGRHPDALPDPRPRRAGAQHQEDGRLRQGARHAPSRPRQDAQVGRRAEAAGRARRRDRRLLPEGLARPRSSPAAASRTSSSPTRCAIRPRSTGWRGCRSSAPASSSASMTWPTSPTSRRRRRSTARRSECFVEIDCGAGRCGVTTTEDVVSDRQGRSPPRRG